MNKRVKFGIIFIAIVSQISILGLSKVFAQDARGFAISPPSFEINANPSDVLTNSIKIENLSDSPLVVVPRVENFVAYGDGGQISLIEEESTYSINTWIKFDELELSVEPHKNSVFNFRIEIPSNTEPGSHYGAVVFSTKVDPATSTGASVIQEIGAIVLIKIPGNINEEASLLNFSATESIFKEPKINFQALLENVGTVHVKPAGFITISDIFGNKIKTIEVAAKNILPGSKRLFDEETEFDGIGIFKADLQLLYKNNEKVITSQISFTALNLQKSVPIAIVVVVIIAFYIIFRKRINKAIKIIVKG
jgi:hypothetical protein